MKKNLINFVGAVLLLALVQLACALPGASAESISENSQSSDYPATQMPEAEQTQATPQPQAPEEQGDQPPTPQGGPACLEGLTVVSNIANGETFQPSESFQVTWTITNTGECTWNTSYALVNLGGDIEISEDQLALGAVVAPGNSTSLSVDMTAPAQPGAYISAWKMTDGQGHSFGLDSPANGPVRVAIKVIPPGNQGNNPTPAPTPAPEENPDMLIQGSGQTLLDGQCFDLNSGSEVDCSDSAADIMYQFALFGKIYAQNNTELSGNEDNEPDKSFCENASYAPMPHTVLEEKFFCFEINSIIHIYYGWIRVERFDEDGITFDFMLFTPTAPEMQPINPNNLFVESQGEQVTMLTGECFDVQDGQPNEQCSGIFAGFLYEEVTKKALQVKQISPIEALFSAAMSTEPTKSDCENASYNQASIWPISETEYYCYQFTPGMNTYHGWLRPTHFDSNGMTFDFLTWEATP